MKQMLVLAAAACLVAGLVVEASDVRGMNRIAGCRATGGASAA